MMISTSETKAGSLVTATFRLRGGPPADCLPDGVSYGVAYVRLQASAAALLSNSPLRLELHDGPDRCINP